MAAVMIVDDAAFTRNILKHALEKAGHVVICEAANGEQAIEKYLAFRPELVIMDIVMPEMGGIQALKEIRRRDPYAIVVMCSAIGQKDTVIEAIQAGAADFIVKPFHDYRVLEALGRVLQHEKASS
ncbi:response regulator [Paenibacillus eucommiae]|uniref:Two-component system chemotaxis response regulator CheY n=1 Tax=Paenibacillus eucommiae TaxID=1355755 RepID=A0ABS4J836_9BACL|nr:response regulator [Paenibacillus eucommiae]MBP1996009.1 two-component system chemotaxis response regulator CheY [Paenibacillus eucommiae]